VAPHVQAFADAGLRDRLLDWLSSVLEERPPERRSERS
jgi:hypothetical protein